MAKLRFPTILILALLAFGPTAGPWTPTPASAASDTLDGGAFQAVIESQVRAFGRGDWAAAFGYASPSIQAMFGDPERFSRMVMAGYEAVARPRVFEFEPPQMIDGRPTQPVYVVGPDGVPKRALYFMERQPDGSWRIDGVVLLPLTDRTT